MRCRRSASTGTVRGPFSFLKVHITWLTYWAIVGVTYAVEQYHESRARELRAAQLQTALARAQVQSLQMQLHPHFLFNTLNAIAALMREDVEAADAMIVGLSDLLRAALPIVTEPEVPLRRELELVQMYLDIQLARLGERLNGAHLGRAGDAGPGCPDTAPPAIGRKRHPSRSVDAAGSRIDCRAHLSRGCDADDPRRQTTAQAHRRR